MKRYLWVGLVMMATTFAAAQNCDKTVYDGASLLNGQQQKVEQAAQGMIQKGADVRVVTVPPNQNLDLVENNYEKSCASWQGAGGVRKSTLIVLMTSPPGAGQHGHLGIYYGAAWHKALDDHWNRIKSEYMVPYFKNGDFAGGFSAAENQLAARITASQDEAVHPATSTTINQEAPTDYSGLWTVLKWIVFLGGLGFGIYLIIVFLDKRRTARAKLLTAQQTAMDYRSRVARQVNLLRTMTLSPEDQNLYDIYLGQFTEMQNSVSYDPSVDGLPLETYESQTNLYRNIFEALRVLPTKAKPANAKSGPDGEDKQGTKLDAEDAKIAEDRKQKASKKAAAKQKELEDQSREILRESQAREEARRERASDTIIAPVIIGNTFGSEEHHHRHDDDYSSSSSSSYSSDSGGGGSSSWSSSDSGGGGGSDFGGGGDSGGGGSSDF